MKKILIFVFFLSACNQFKHGEGDMLYKFYSDKPGETIKENDVIVWTAVEKTEEGAVIYKWYNYGRPIMFKREKSLFKGDLYTALGMMSEGDSAVFKINIDSLEAKMGRLKPSGTNGKYLVYEISIKKVFHESDLSQEEFASQIEQYINTEMNKLKKKELPAINSYIKDKKLMSAMTVSGLRYLVIRKGNGPIATPGDTVIMNYTAMQLNGNVFDTTDPAIAAKNKGFNSYQHTFNGLTHPYQAIKIVAGYGMYPQGLEEALLLLPAGTKAVLIIPSKLAFGEIGVDSLKPYTPLIYEIDILSIRMANK